MSVTNFELTPSRWYGVCIRTWQITNNVSSTLKIVASTHYVEAFTTASTGYPARSYTDLTAPRLFARFWFAVAEDRFEPRPGRVRLLKKNYLNTSYAHDDQGDNPGQENRGLDGVLYKL